MTSQATQPSVFVRSAVAADCGELKQLCRENFPDSLRWQSDRLAQKWWDAALSSEAVRTWVCQCDGRVAAFCVQVVDERKWAEERARRKRTIREQLLCSTVHPIIGFRDIRRLVSGILVTNEQSIIVDSVPPVDWTSLTRTWVELLAVKREYMRRGIARILLEYCDSHTRQLGRDAIALLVDTDNPRAIALYESQGYTYVSTKMNRHLFAKKL